MPSRTGTDRVVGVFAGLTGLGSSAPERFEASTRIRAGERHRLGVGLGAVRFGTPIWAPVKNDQAERLGQFSVRAIDEWIVRDGIVVVLGLDYSRFIGAGGESSLIRELEFSMM